MRRLVRGGMVRPTKSTNTYDTAQITIPAHIARRLPAGVSFRPEWHPEGILYRYVGLEKEAPTEIPRWAE